VFVVASARDDLDPAAVLFEFDGVRRDTAPSREAGKNTAKGTRTGVAVSSHWDGDYPHPTLNQSAKGSGGVGSSNQEIFSQRGAYLAPQPMTARMVSFGEYIDDGTASAMKARDYKDATDLVAQPIPINSMNALRGADADPTTGCGIGEAGEAMFTITKGHSHAVAQPIVLMDQGGSVMNVEHDMVGTLRRETHGHEPVVAQPVAFQSAGGVVREIGDVMSTLDAARESRGTNQQRFLMQSMAVRRLTPVECERLQGFPDGYTNIPWRKKDESPDGPRYKALGNSWAVPVVRWIGKRIQEQINAS
jgi:DNA (cytosine-5)-methyltransferase 1